MCGAEFAIPEREHLSTGVAIGKDSGLGTVALPLADKRPKPNKAMGRIEALKAAGVDVSHLFAMQGADGNELVVSNKGGSFNVIGDDDPLFDLIRQEGDVPNRKLFRRWVMAQMFRMLAGEKDRGNRFWEKGRSVTEQIHGMGYEYTWQMLMDELRAQSKMWSNNDITRLSERNRWFNGSVALSMMDDYMKQLKKYVNALPKRKCKGVPYVRIHKENIFMEDLQKKVFGNLEQVIANMRKEASEEKLNPLRTACYVSKFNSLRVKLAPVKMRSKDGRNWVMLWEPSQCKEWMEAYKGSGAYFTMQNLIRFHGCFLMGMGGKLMDKADSLRMLDKQAVIHSDKKEGYRMLGILKKMLKDNHMDVDRKREEWRKK